MLNIIKHEKLVFLFLNISYIIRHHNFVSSIISITYIWESYFTLRSEKNHFDTILVSRSATQPPPLPPRPRKRHIDVKRGNLSMDVTPTLCHDNNIQLLFSTYKKVQSTKKAK